MSESQEIARISVNWSKACDKLPPFLQSLKSMVDARCAECSDAKKLHDENPDCTYVYYACGTCTPIGGGEGYKVEEYCDGGGSEPDYTYCYKC